jgi:hypothetical protein
VTRQAEGVVWLLRNGIQRWRWRWSRLNSGPLPTRQDQPHGQDGQSQNSQEDQGSFVHCSFHYILLNLAFGMVSSGKALSYQQD